jgi:hypothetical protein
VADLKQIDVLEALELADKALPSNDLQYITCSDWRGYSILISVLGDVRTNQKSVERTYSIDTGTGNGSRFPLAVRRI